MGKEYLKLFTVYQRIGLKENAFIMSENFHTLTIMALVIKTINSIHSDFAHTLSST